MSEEKYSSMRVRHSTAKRLMDMGFKNETYDDIISYLLDHAKKRKR